MKLALIGLGRWAMNVLQSLPTDTTLAAVVSRRADASSLVPQGCRRLRRTSDLCSVDVDAVIVANQASLHVETLREIWMVDSRMPVFVEKPVGISLAEVEGLATARLTAGSIFLVDHIQLFNSNLLSLRQLFADARPCSITGVDCNSGPVRSDCSPLWDYGPHAVAIALYFSGCREATNVVVRSASRTLKEHGAMIDFELEVDGETDIRMSVGNGGPAKRREYRFTEVDGPVHVFDGLSPVGTPPLAAALQFFCDAVRRGAAPMDDLRFGWKLPLAVSRVLQSVEDALDGLPAPAGI